MHFGGDMPGGGMHFGGGMPGDGMHFGSGVPGGRMFTGRSVFVPGGNRFAGAPFASWQKARRFLAGENDARRRANDR